MNHKYTKNIQSLAYSQLDKVLKQGFKRSVLKQR